MEVHRINMIIASGNDVTSEPTKLNLERILGQEMIQKIPPPESDNKAESKINTQTDINPERPSIMARRFNPEIFDTLQKLFGFTSLNKAYIKTKTHTGSIGAASFPPQLSRFLHKPQIFKFIYA